MKNNNTYNHNEKNMKIPLIYFFAVGKDRPRIFMFLLIKFKIVSSKVRNFLKSDIGLSWPKPQINFVFICLVENAEGRNIFLKVNGVYTV